MNRFLSLILLGLFSFNTVGYIFIFHWQVYVIRKEIKREIKQGIPQDKLCQITVTEKNYRDLNWINEKEFILNGVMYDVVRKKINGQYSVTYQCVNDTQETILFADLASMIDQNMDLSHHGKNPFKFLMNQVFLTQFSVFDFHHGMISKNHHTRYSIGFFPNVLLNQVDNPPDISC